MKSELSVGILGTMWLAPEWFTRKKWWYEKQLEAYHYDLRIYYDFLLERKYPNLFDRIWARYRKRITWLDSKLWRINKIASRRLWR